MYVYKQTEPGLFTVGFYQPDGVWVPESDHGNIIDASKRVAFLNGAQRERELQAVIHCESCGYNVVKNEGEICSDCRIAGRG